MAPSGRGSAPHLSWDEVSTRRLTRNGLAEPLVSASPADVVAAMCGAHAQVLSAAELSIGARLADGTLTDVRRALWTEHSLMKTFGPRGTVHLLPARDLATWIGALAALPRAGPIHPEGVRLTPNEIDEVVEAMAAALQDLEVTADELGEAVVAATGPWAGELTMEAFQGTWPRWRLALYPAAHRGVLCFGPNRGSKVTYTSPARWLPAFRPIAGKTALAQLVERYLHAYGPATPQHFARWLAAPPAWATELFESLASKLEEIEVDGTSGWVVRGDTDAPAARPPGVHLLPYFDAYTIAFQPRDLLFPGRAAERALAGSQAGNFPVLLIDGVVAGVWHLRRVGKKLTITVEPLKPLTGEERRQLDAQVARIGEFLEGTPELTLGTVTAGAHA